MIDNKIPKCRVEYFEVFHQELIERIKQKERKEEGAISAIEEAMK
jgi:chromosome condensin MukBEF ATPase and DNA-binding subunit MukB